MPLPLQIYCSSALAGSDPDEAATFFGRPRFPVPLEAVGFFGEAAFFPGGRPTFPFAAGDPFVLAGDLDFLVDPAGLPRPRLASPDFAGEAACSTFFSFFSSFFGAGDFVADPEALSVFGGRPRPRPEGGLGGAFLVMSDLGRPLPLFSPDATAGLAFAVFPGGLPRPRLAVAPEDIFSDALLGDRASPAGSCTASVDMALSVVESPQG